MAIEGLSTGTAALLLFVVTAVLLQLAQGAGNTRFARITAILSMPVAAAAIYFTFIAFTGEDDLGDILMRPQRAVRDIAGDLLDRTTAKEVAAVTNDQAIAYRGRGLVGDEFKDCVDCPLMIVIPSGYGEAGAEPDDELAGPEEHPRRSIKLPARLAMARHEITAGEYAKFTAATGHPQPQCPAGHRPTVDNEPVHCVSPTDALAYVDWLIKTTGRPYRLPSQTEWEFAARGGSKERFTSGRSYEPGKGDLNPTAARPSMVRTQAANLFGIYGAHGGVAEITADCWYPTLETIPTDGRTPDPSSYCQWYTLKDAAWMEPAARARFSARRPVQREHRDGGIGFRVIRDVTPGSFSN